MKTGACEGYREIEDFRDRESKIRRYITRDSDRSQCENNGEGSLVRFRMAGCGPVDLSSKRVVTRTDGCRIGSSPNGETRESLSPCSLQPFSLEKKNAGEKETIFRIIELLSQKALTQSQIANKLGLTTRTIRYILSKLLKDGIISQRANLLDARQSYYEVIK